MSLTAHRAAQTFYVDKGTFNFFAAPWYPVLERDGPVDTIYLDPAGTDAILLDGQRIDTATLQAYKIKHNVFIAVGGND